MAEAGKQGKKLFSASDAKNKTKALLATLGTNGAEQAKALQALFWSDFSGYWNPRHKKWDNVGSVSYLGLSEVDADGGVRAVHFKSDLAIRNWHYRYYPQSFLACEDC